MIIDFKYGTLIISDWNDDIDIIKDLVQFDERIDAYRSNAYNYAEIIISLHKNKINYTDNAKDFSPVEFSFQTDFTPMEHQQKAFDAWISCGKRGIVEMPTGSGKSFLAMLAINNVNRQTLIIVPTIDLMQQWASNLERAFNMKIGMLGGGSKEIKDITVSTYDSAVIMMEFIGNKFGFIIFDECHHLPGPVNRLSASMSIAPYRMALTATLERDDGEEKVLEHLVGPVAYNIHIDELEGDILSEYKTQRITLSLEPDELQEYNNAREIYTNFLKQNRIYFRQKNDWSRFIISCARMPNGKEVMNAYLKQKRIARSGRSKLKKIWELIIKHKNERIIIFTAENDSAYNIGKQFFLPVITHRTKAIERKDFLDKFRAGTYPVLITSKVLNEGVDIPEASVGIIVSGSGSIREHVQRLGRILRRKKNGRQAVLYELISTGTSEEYVSERRRQHRAFS